MNSTEKQAYFEGWLKCQLGEITRQIGIFLFNEQRQMFAQISDQGSQKAAILAAAALSNDLDNHGEYRDLDDPDQSPLHYYSQLIGNMGIDAPQAAVKLAKIKGILGVKPKIKTYKQLQKFTDLISEIDEIIDSDQ